MIRVANRAMIRAPALQAGLKARCLGTTKFVTHPASVGSMSAQITANKNQSDRQWNLKLWASLGAGAAGVALCASQPSRADGAAPVALKPFSLDGFKYDMDSFQGRCWAMYELIDPRNLLVTGTQIDKAKQLLEDYKKAGKPPAGVSNEDMWEAKTIIDINVHPVTGEVLWAPGRMSAFIPANVPIVLFMTLAKGAPMIAVSQWTNQTYNVICNYVNRSGKEVDMASLGQSYVLALAASIGIAVSGNWLVTNIAALQSLGILVPYTAVAMASSANLGFTRMDEWMGRGVPLCDADGKEVGVSLLGGKSAVIQTALTRCCLLPIAPMILPGLVVKAMGLTSFAAKMTVELSLITVAYAVVMPPLLAILPQRMELDVKDLEPAFQNLKDSKGQPITKVFGNKGL